MVANRIVGLLARESAFGSNVDGAGEGTAGHPNLGRPVGGEGQ